jgi:hypothetical protein
MDAYAVFTFFRAKTQQRCYTSGVAMTARNLRKQGVPFEVAYYLIFDRGPRL